MAPRKPPARKSPARKPPARKSPARKSPARRAAPKKRTTSGRQSRGARWLRRLRTGLLWWMGVGVVVPIGQVLLLRVVDPPITPTMLGRSLSRWQETGSLALPQREWVDLDALPEHLIAAAVASEDARFFAHAGFDWEAIDHAWQARQAGSGTAGGSTISQQTAKNVFLWQGRSWLRKGLEVWYTFWLERLLSKERILEVYLNIAETGPMTFGVQAGAKLWFDRPAAELTPLQSASLICLLPAPRVWTPESVRARAQRIEQQRLPLPEGFR